MKVRALNSFSDSVHGSRAAGDEFELPEGVDWLRAGLVEVVTEPVWPATPITAEMQADIVLDKPVLAAPSDEGGVVVPPDIAAGLIAAAEEGRDITATLTAPIAPEPKPARKKAKGG